MFQSYAGRVPSTKLINLFTKFQSDVVTQSYSDAVFSLLFSECTYKWLTTLRGSMWRIPKLSLEC